MSQKVQLCHRGRKCRLTLSLRKYLEYCHLAFIDRILLLMENTISYFITVISLTRYQLPDLGTLNGPEHLDQPIFFLDNVDNN